MNSKTKLFDHTRGFGFSRVVVSPSVQFYELHDRKLSPWSARETDFTMTEPDLGLPVVVEKKKKNKSSSCSHEPHSEGIDLLLNSVTEE
jgi:hypothetical protein